MKQKLKQPLYGLRTDPRALDLKFYERFDANFLFNKAVTLMAAITAGDEFKKQLNEVLQEQKGGTLDEKYSNSLRAELYFMVFHQFESLFALLISPFQDLPEWIYLTAYRTEELKDSIEHFIKGNFKEITQGRCENEQQFTSATVYCESMASDSVLQAKWHENLNNIAWLVRRIGRIYLDELKAYNSYKHGLRVMVGPSYFSLYLNDAAGVPMPQGPGFSRFSEDSLSYLEFEQKDGIREVHEVTKHFNPEVSFFYLSKMHQMLETMKATRLAALQGNPNNVTINMFFELDKDDIVLRSAQRNFTYSHTI